MFQKLEPRIRFIVFLFVLEAILFIGVGLFIYHEHKSYTNTSHKILVELREIESIQPLLRKFAVLPGKAGLAGAGLKERKDLQLAVNKINATLNMMSERALLGTKKFAVLETLKIKYDKILKLRALVDASNAKKMAVEINGLVKESIDSSEEYYTLSYFDYKTVDIFWLKNKSYLGLGAFFVIVFNLIFIKIIYDRYKLRKKAGA